MVRNLDRKGQGVVNWKQLATYIILLRSPLPTDKDLESFKKNFHQLSGEHLLLDKTSFLKVIFPTYLSL